jgi:hypothetical protein
MFPVIVLKTNVVDFVCTFCRCVYCVGMICGWMTQPVLIKLWRSCGMVKFKVTSKVLNYTQHLMNRISPGEKFWYAVWSCVLTMMLVVLWIKHSLWTNCQVMCKNTCIWVPVLHFWQIYMAIKCECCAWNVCHFVLLESHLSITRMWAIVWFPCFGAPFRFTKLDNQLQCEENIFGSCVHILSKLGWLHTIYEIKNYAKPCVDCLLFIHNLMKVIFHP